MNQWIEENRHLLKPPVGNQQLYVGNTDFIVMVVGGPNARKDFHVNQGEEFFYQLEGEIILELMVPNPSHPEGPKVLQKVPLKAGEIFLLPPGIPHGPRRPAGSIGLVIERYRNQDELDAFQWYCDDCQSLVHEILVPVSDIVGQLPKLMDGFYADPQLSTCVSCGHRITKP